MRQFLIFLFVSSLFSSSAMAGYQEGLNAINKQDYQTALKELQHLAEAGDATAQSDLGDLYRLGSGVPKNFEEAFYWYQLAAIKGNTVAQLNLAGMYFYGIGIQKNDEQAMRWTRKAAIRGYDKAQFLMGQMFSEGTHIKQDLVKAAEWFRKAAMQGNVASQIALAKLSLEGKGVPQSLPNAAEWYRKAADQGDYQAMSMLGYLYEKGQGVAKKPELAARLYRKAADAGVASAQYRLGLLYAWGTGVPIDYKEAELLWKKAANQGVQEAKDQLDRWHQKSEPAESNQTAQFSDVEKSYVATLPLKEGLWKLHVTTISGTVSATEDETTTESHDATWCSKGTGLTAGKVWPIVSDKESAVCEETTISETENNREFKTKCDGGMFIVEGRTILSKVSENDYLFNSSQLYRFDLNSHLSGLGEMLPIPPSKVNFSLKASYSGACLAQ
ncbi:tetratricopeptide repeat protein [Undibacterium sp. TJN19]|uniref:tetratricopeptide repeat protein n=1 Tax=Undibacterium sp. TJN19 TaxID=3413055 RepID=UPI003BF1A1AA